MSSSTVGTSTVPTSFKFLIWFNKAWPIVQKTLCIDIRLLQLWAGGRIRPTCRMWRINWCLDGSTSTAWDYAGLIYVGIRDVGLRRPLQSRLKRLRYAIPKRCHYFQTPRVQPPLNPFYTWCNMLLTRLHHFSVVGIVLLPWNSSTLPPVHSFACTRATLIKNPFLRSNEHNHSYNYQIFSFFHKK